MSMRTTRDEAAPDSEASEFEEIAHSGGRFTLTPEPDGLVTEFTHCAPARVTMFQVAVTLKGTKGTLAAIVPVGGIGPMPPYPRPSILAWIISDREGLFGRTCPACASYFRTDHLGDTTCPYCEHTADALAFTTKNQRLFVEAFCRAVVAAQESRKEVVVDLDALADGLPENKGAWVYKEERQQTRFKCASCDTDADILGPYGACPECARRNDDAIFAAKMKAFADRHRSASETLTGRQERETVWADMVRSVVAEFDALGNDLAQSLARLPLTPRRRKDVQELSFQSLFSADKNLSEWFAIRILEGVTDDDRVFLHKMFHRRHLLTHNAGRVDQDYLDATKDTTVKLNETVRVRSNEVERLIRLVTFVGARLTAGYASISTKA